MQPALPSQAGAAPPPAVDRHAAPRLVAAGRALGRATSTKLWPIAALVFALALAASLTSSPGRYVPDIRFEVFWSPGRALARHASVWVPDPGLGRVREGAMSGPLAIISLLRAAGLSPMLAERVWHALLLAGAGTGAAAVIGLFRHRVGTPHLVAALAYAFNPYTVSALIPSTLFLAYAMSPWFLVLFVRGVRDGGRWRAPAAFALCVYLVGTTNPPAVLYAGLPMLPFGVALLREEGGWRRVASWTGRALALSLLVSAASLTATWFSFDALVASIEASEDPRRVNVTSSWAETLRGLGNWVAYGTNGGDPWVPHTATFFTSPWRIIATFLLPISGLIAFWRGSRPERVIFAALTLIGAAVMVGAFPVDDPPPFGRAVLLAYDNVPGATSFRNTYKAGSALMLGLAGLVGLGVTGLAASRRLRPQVLAMAAVVVVAGSAVPFWSGDMYNPNYSMGAVPGYWREAVEWLDTRPGDARVMVLPGSQATTYRWGTPGDDLFDGLLRRGHVVRTWLPAGTPVASSVIADLDDRIQSGRYVPGSLAPLARELGIRWIVVRNDLDWQRSLTARPAALQAVRDELNLVATFGRRGENTVGNNDASLFAITESSYHPVQIYEIPLVPEPLSVRPARPPLLLAGDGSAWSRLAASGDLEAATVHHVAAMDPEEVVRALRVAGSEVVVTDTNRRRVRTATGFVNNMSYTLANGELLDGRGSGVLGGAGHETVSTYGAAARITASSYGTPLSGQQPALRPSNAFDGDTGTAWRAGGLSDPRGEWVRAALVRPAVVGHVELVAEPATGDARRVSRARVRFSEGPDVLVDLSDGRQRQAFSPRLVSWVEFRIEDVSGSGLAPVGFSEIRIADLDLTEVISVGAGGLDRVASTEDGKRALALAGFRFEFERSVLSNELPEERHVRRRFATWTPRRFDISGQLTLPTDIADRFVDQALGLPVGASGSEPWFGGDWRNAGTSAVDGDPASAWRVPPHARDAITVRFPATIVRSVRVVTPDTSVLRTVDIQVRDQVTRAAVQPGVTNVVLPVSLADQLSIAVVDASVLGTDGDEVPVAISEIEVNGVANRPIPSEQPLAGCVPAILRLDGSPVGARLAGRRSDLRPGQPLTFEACSPIELPVGEHRLTSRPDLTVERVTLASSGRTAAAPQREVRYEVRRRSPAASTLRVEADGPFEIRSGAGYDPSWRSSVDGRSLGPPDIPGAEAGWRVDSAGTHEVTLEYAPQRVHRVALLLSGIGLVACLVLVARRTTS